MVARFAFTVLFTLTSLAGWQDPETVRQSEAQFARGVDLQQKGDLDGARQAYEAALKLIPRRIDALSNLWWRAHTSNSGVVGPATSRLAGGALLGRWALGEALPGPRLTGIVLVVGGCILLGIAR